MYRRCELRVYVRFPRSIDMPRYRDVLYDALRRVGLSEYPDDMVVGEKTVVLVYRDSKAIAVWGKVSQHPMCSKKVFNPRTNTYACFDALGEIFWMFVVTTPAGTRGRRRWLRSSFT